MSRTIVNQGAATPLALLEAFRLVTTCEGEALTFEDACYLLGSHGWAGLERQKVDAWENALEDSRRSEARAEFESVGLAPTAPNTTFPNRWDESLQLSRRLPKDKYSELPQAVALLHKATSDIKTVLFETGAVPTVLRELVNLSIVEERSEDGALEIRKPWRGAPIGVPAEWFFARLSRYFLRAWNDDDRDYRLLGHAYRAWLDVVKPDDDGELAFLRGRMDAALFIDFNARHSERLKIKMNAEKLRAWTRAVCQIGLCWIVAGIGEYERPFPDPSQLIEWSIDELLKPGGDISLDEFVARFGRIYPVLDYSTADALPFGLSFALRSLHDSGTLELRFEGDAGVKTRLGDDHAHRVPRANRVRRPK